MRHNPSIDVTLWYTYETPTGASVSVPLALEGGLEGIANERLAANERLGK